MTALFHLKGSRFVSIKLDEPCNCLKCLYQAKNLSVLCDRDIDVVSASVISLLDFEPVLTV